MKLFNDDFKEKVDPTIRLMRHGTSFRIAIVDPKTGNVCSGGNLLDIKQDGTVHLIRSVDTSFGLNLDSYEGNALTLGTYKA